MTYAEFCDKYEEKEKGLHCKDKLSTYYFDCPSVVKALAEKGVSVSGLVSEALKESNNETLAAFFAFWAKRLMQTIDLIYEEKEAFEMEVEPLSDSLFCIANDLQDLIDEIIDSKRLNRDKLLKTLRILQRQAEDDSGK